MKNMKKFLALGLVAAMTMSMAACGGSEGETTESTDTAATTETGETTESTESTESSGEKTKIQMFFWETLQKPGMEALAAKYMETHPDVQIECEVSTWSEYWTKLEAMANAGSLPDVFWMHTNEFSKYASAGLLADLTDLYDDVEENYYRNHFPEALVDNFSYDGKIYGVMKDIDTIGLVYNKDIFDEAGVAYPDDTWTWDDLKAAAQEITDKTGKYGFGAPMDEQSGWANLIYQAGGVYVEDGKPGFDQEGTQKGIKEYISWQKDYNFSPTQEQFSDTGLGDRFVAGEIAMAFYGSWGISNLELNYPDLNWACEVLPACPDPVKGDGRASISNGLAYSTSADNPNLDTIKEFIKWLGTEEAAIIHGESGAAIPAYNGTGDSWAKLFEGRNVEAYVEMLDYRVQYPFTMMKSQWWPEVENTILNIYSDNISFEDAMVKCQEAVNEAEGN